MCTAHNICSPVKEEDLMRWNGQIKTAEDTLAEIDGRLKCLYMIQELSKAIDLEVRPT